MIIREPYKTIFISEPLYGRTILKKLYNNRRRRSTTFLQITIQNAEDWIIFLPKEIKYDHIEEILLKHNEF